MYILYPIQAHSFSNSQLTQLIIFDINVHVYYVVAFNEDLLQ